MFPIKRKVLVHKGDFDYTGFDLGDRVVFCGFGHPGSFGFTRKNHIHEGVDLYCQDGEPVYAIEDGEVVGVFDFTGQCAHSPWWNETQCVLIEGQSGVINYGEIVVEPSLRPGLKVKEGDLIGHVAKVLKKDKGRPMAMLHLELYEAGTKEPIKEWPIDSPIPSQLRNPADLLAAEMFSSLDIQGDF